MAFKRLVLIVLILIFASPCFAEDFYVSASEAGAKDGSSLLNCWAYSDVFGSNAKWANPKEDGKIGPGDTVYINQGTYNTQIASQANGDSGSPITIAPLNGTVTVTIAAYSGTSTIPIYINHNYIVVDGGTSKNIRVTGSVLTGSTTAVGVVTIGASCQGVKVTQIQVDNNGNNSYGIKINQHTADVAGAVEVSYNTVSENNQYGIGATFSTTKPTTHKRILIHHNTVSGLYEDGIICAQRGCDIYNNTVTKISAGKTTEHTDPINCAASYCKVHENVIYDIQQNSKVTNSYIYLGLYNSPSLRLEDEFADIHTLDIVDHSTELESYSANVTPGHTSASATDYDSLLLTVGADAGANELLATEAFTSKNLSTYNFVSIAIKSSVALDAGDLQLLLDDTANCASPLETLNIPATPANTWTRHTIALANPASDTAIISWGIKQAVDKGAFAFNMSALESRATASQTAEWTEIDVYNNLIYESYSVATSNSKGIYITQTYGSDSLSNVRVSNNTIIGLDGEGIWLQDNTGTGSLSGISIEGNIIKNCGNLTSFAAFLPPGPNTFASHGGTAGIIFDYNSISGTNASGPKVSISGATYDTLAALQAATTIQDNGLGTDPGLSATYYPQSLSNILSGIAQAYFTKDKDGKTRSRWTLGCYEWANNFQFGTGAGMKLGTGAGFTIQ